MKKVVFFGFIFFIFYQSVFAQLHLPITVTHSQNGKFSISSVSYGLGMYRLKGLSTVYSGSKVLYKIGRSFPLFAKNNDIENAFLTISNDGSTVAYLSQITYPYPAYENVVIYKNGKFLKSYTLKEYSSCDTILDNSKLFYANSDKIMDYVAVPDSGFRWFYKKDVSEQELFLYKNSVLSHSDTIYSTDPQKMVTVFDLRRVRIIEKVPFDSIYSRIKNYKRTDPDFDYALMSSKHINDFKVKGKSTKVSDTLEKLLGVPFINLDDPDLNKYKFYKVGLKGYLGRDGVFTIDEFSSDSLDKKRIEKFFQTTKFEAGMISPKLEKQYFYFFGAFGRPLNEAAEKEIIAKKQELKRRLTLDSINHVYIPPNIRACFIELDKKLEPEVVLKLNALKSAGEMGLYHFGMGMWMRNNWGLWSGSRLSAYMTQRGFRDPDSMSNEILRYYYYWFKGNKEIYKEFEAKYPAD
ncbi:DUF6794 domain-containing protein [Pedobacter sp. B4-66]|uniref:DUF6794 domain-containing protein n=1 Tax=Pedobacter sp. B4-66 TaxID=2817280 RepID=UPI001BD964FF|nr:DUF6794 domain-containing protein [Pedobacter sp. B4-66]